MRVVVTGTSSGIGHAIAGKFVRKGHTVFGIDIKEAPEDLLRLNASVYLGRYRHCIADVSDMSSLPNINEVDILINNAGVQNSGRDMQINFFGVKNCTEKYGLHEGIKSILNQASVSAHNGAEFPEYTASKGAVLAYTKWTAHEIAKYGATCNSLSCGGVCTPLNQPVMNDPSAWAGIMDVTPLKKWATPGEIADWVYFLTVVNKSCTAQDIIIDNGETSDTHFVWPQ